VPGAYIRTAALRHSTTPVNRKVETRTQLPRVDLGD
jgi:hypothetical protein